MKNILNKLRNLKKDSNGQALVLVAVSLAVLLGFGALTTDLGFLFVQRRNAQNIADAAALAGAHNLPYLSKAEDLAIEYTKKNGFAEEDVTVVTPYKGDPTKINVTIIKEFSTSLARILKINETTISASAVAVKIPWWNGEALPLVNTGNNYVNETIVLRTNHTPGDKSLLLDFYSKVDSEGDKHYYVNYSEGIEIAQGTETQNKDKTLHLIDVIEDLFSVEPKESDRFYILSIKSDILDDFLYNGKPIIVTDKHGNMQERYSDKGGGLHAGDIIHKAMLVLLECSYVSRKTANNTEIKFEYIKEYDINNNEFPINYITPFGGKSKLIE